MSETKHNAPETLRLYTELLDKHSKALAENEKLKADKAELLSCLNIISGLLESPIEQLGNNLATDNEEEIDEIVQKLIAKHKEK